MSIYNAGHRIDADSYYPVGSMAPFAGTTAPEGWLLCNGKSYSRETYADLYKIIGTTYGSDGSDTFKVPDMRDRYVKGASGTSTYALGKTTTATSTTAATTLSVSQLPSHNHSITDPGHSHTYSKTTVMGNRGSYYSGDWWSDRQETTNTSSATTGVTINNAGSGGSHSHNLTDLHPNSIFLNYIIKF